MGSGALPGSGTLAALAREDAGGRLDAFVERAEAGRSEASRVFRENGGEELLGSVWS